MIYGVAVRDTGCGAVSLAVLFVAHVICCNKSEVRTVVYPIGELLRSTRYNMPLHAARHCNMLQHAATQCNTVQYTEVRTVM